jgi:site-specific DNA-cytosine methylase
MDLGLERAGMVCKWQVEKDAACRGVLSRRWPEVDRFGDIRAVAQELRYADVIAGGDPCPKHSRARSNGKSKSPDLAGYFLAVVGRLRPGWVVRENVPAPTVSHFTAALEYLGYRAVVVRMDAAQITGQSRQRDFVVANHKTSQRSLVGIFSDCRHGAGRYTTSLGTRQIIPALTTHRTRYDSRDCYVWEEGNGLRILDAEEREAFAGFPKDWTLGLSEGARAKVYGNAVVPAIAQFIGERIMEAAS